MKPAPTPATSSSKTKTTVAKKPVNKQQQPRAHKPEQGNVFFLVLAGIALFAALSFTVSRSSNTKSTTILTEKQASLAASEAMDFAQSTARGVSRLLTQGCSENQISFESPPFDGSSDYANSDAPNTLSCHVFSSAGGRVKFRNLPEEWRATGTGDIAPTITATLCIPDIGTGEKMKTAYLIATPPIAICFS